MKLNPKKLKTLLLSGFSAAIISNNVIGASLLHNWTFDSDLTDSVGGLNATANGNAGIQTVTSKIGAGAAIFDGQDDSLIAGTSGDFNIGTDTRSVSFWYNSDNIETSDRFLSTGNQGFTFFARLGTGVDADFNSPGSGRRIQGATVTGGETGVWHLVVGVFDYNGGDGTVNIYVDSILEETIARSDFGIWDTGSIGSPVGLVFGANGDNNRSNEFDGFMDDVAIWNGALSQSDVNSLWNGGAGLAAAAVPEPSSLALLSFGGIALIRRRRR